jgi:hypothetical protein
MVEPLEETRTELTFATEPILSSLELSIPGAGRRTPLVELDEVEVCDTFYFLNHGHRMWGIPSALDRRRLAPLEEW